MHVLVLAFVALVTAQPPAQPAAAPPATPPPGEPAPPPKSIQPEAQKEVPVPAIDRLEPTSRKLVERQVANFIVTQDGKYWDRQVWLKRQELRDKMRRSVGANARPNDVERAHGASPSAPLDPTDEADGIKRINGVYYYGNDITNPPLWRAADGTTALTAEEIAAARNAPKAADAKAPAPQAPAPVVPPSAKPGPVPAAPIRESVSPAELADALLAKKAELSVFKWSKRLIKPAQLATKAHGNTLATPAVPEEAEYVWRRDPLPVKWLKEPTPAKPATP